MKTSFTSGNSQGLLVGNFNGDNFIKKYWQKRPVLIRQAFKDFPQFVSPEELAGLSCEREVISRLILEKGGKVPWELLKGPFNRRTFAKLPKKHWTLLVNGVDRFVPSVNELLDSFRFLPNWRIDDVMISYAADKGGVGAHIDNYDVFLIQAMGKREWQIHTEPLLVDEYIPNRAVRQLKQFKPNRKWILEPGDMLYLPPRVPHNGIARSNGCMTYSIGFRAASYSELVDNAVCYALSQIDENARYADADLKVSHPGEIPATAIKKVQKILELGIPKGDDLIEWFGSFVTEPKDSDVELELEELIDEKELKSLLKTGLGLIRTEGTRVAYAKNSKKQVLLFVNSRPLLLGRNLGLAQVLTSGVRIDAQSLLKAINGKTAYSLVCDLINRGAFLLETEENID